MSANCNIVKDLLPLYTDGLTSEESNQLIEEHFTSCESCKKEYTMMKEVNFPYQVDVPEPATETENKLLRRIKNRLATILITVIVTFTIFGMFIGAFGGVLFQEGNPIKVGAAIMKLQFTDKEFVEIENGKYISSFEGNEALVLKEEMKRDGWKFVEQFGSGYLFEKGEETLTVSTRMFTRNYYVWTVPEQATKEK